MNNIAFFEDTMAEIHAREARLAPLWEMSPTERADAMYSGRLSREQCWAWGRRYPDEVPRLNGEWWFIAITTPEIADAPAQKSKATERHLTLVPTATDSTKTAEGGDLRDVA
jgi:hypothetical protein